jgi:hypothetical protein
MFLLILIWLSSLFPTLAEPQIDRAKGKAVAADFPGVKSRCQIVGAKWSAINSATWGPRSVVVDGMVQRIWGPRKYDDTVDGALIEKHLEACVTLSDSIQEDIYDLDYEHAHVDLDELKKHIAVAEIVISELVHLPMATVQSEGKVEEQTEPVKNLPSHVSGRQIRARIASELSFAQRATARADLNMDFYISREVRGVGAENSCDSAVDKFVTETTRTAQSFGVGKQYRYLEPDEYFSLADEALSFLNYEAAHRMAYVAYEDAQKILADCKSQ